MQMVFKTEILHAPINVVANHANQFPSKYAAPFTVSLKTFSVKPRSFVRSGLSRVISHSRGKGSQRKEVRQPCTDVPANWVLSSLICAPWDYGQLQYG